MLSINFGYDLVLKFLLVKDIAGHHTTSKASQ